MNNPFETLEQRLSNIEYLLADMKHQAGSTPDPGEDLLNIQQTAKLISLAVPSIYGLVHRHEIPHSKKGRRLYFSKTEILEWIRAGRRKTLAEARMNPEKNLKPLKQRKGAVA